MEIEKKTVAILEWRMAKEMAALIERQGAQIYLCPLVEQSASGASEKVASFLDQLLSDQIELMIFLTGIGARFLLQTAEARGQREALLAALNRTRVVVRGPKPLAVMRQLGIRVDHQATEPTSEGIIETLAEIDLHGKVVGLQLTGEANDYLKSELEQRGAQVAEVSPYEYRLASSEDQVNELIAKIIKAEVQIVTFTTAPQVRMLFAQAAQTGKRDELRHALNERVAIASIGPVVDRALGEEDLLPRIKPERSVMGSLAKAVGAFLKQ